MVAATTDEILHALQLECEVDQLQRSLHKARLESRRRLAELEATSQQLLAATEYRRAVYDMLLDEFFSQHDPRKFGEHDRVFVALDRRDWSPRDDIPYLILAEIEPTESCPGRELQFRLFSFGDEVCVYECIRLT